MYNSVIFALSSLLLVPFLYYAASIPEVCAEAKDPNWGKKGNCWYSEPGVMTCCWTETDPKDPKKTIEKCQMCEDGGPSDTYQCGPVITRTTSPQTGPTIPPQGSVLETPPTKMPPKTFGNLGGQVLQVQPLGNDTTTISEENVSSSNASNNTLAQLQSNEDSDSVDQIGSTEEENGDDTHDTEDENNE